MTGRLILPLRKAVLPPPQKSLQTFQHPGTWMCSIVSYRTRGNCQASSMLHTDGRIDEVLANQPSQRPMTRMSDAP